VKLLSGGPRWIDQIAAALATVSPDATHVIVHDAARPVVAYSDIDALITAAEKYPVAALASPLRAGLVETDEGGNPVAFHSPAHYQNVLTPQVFSRAAFTEFASKKTELHPSRWTLLSGSPLNIRVGGPTDAVLAKAMLGLLPKPKMKAGLSPFDEAQW